MDNIPQSAQEFEHFHEHFVRDIEDIVRAARETAHGPDQQRVSDLFESFFGDEAATYMAPTDAKPDPEQILKIAMSKLKDVSRLELVASNLLEGVKDGQSLKDLVERYQSLGLLEERRSPALPRGPQAAQNMGDGSFLEKALGWARKLGTLLWRMGVNAVRTIPRFVKLKPNVTFGFVGPVPTFGLNFELEAEALTLHELGDLLTRGLGATT